MSKWRHERGNGRYVATQPLMPRLCPLCQTRHNGTDRCPAERPARVFGAPLGAQACAGCKASEVTIAGLTAALYAANVALESTKLVTPVVTRNHATVTTPKRDRAAYMRDRRAVKPATKTPKGRKAMSTPMICRTCHVAHLPSKPHVFTGRPAGAAGGKVACPGCADRNAIIERLTDERVPMARQIETLEAERTIDRELIAALQGQINVLKGASRTLKPLKPATKAKPSAKRRSKAGKKRAQKHARRARQEPTEQSTAAAESTTRLSNPRTPPT